MSNKLSADYFSIRERGDQQLVLAGNHTVKHKKQFLGYAHKIIRYLNHNDLSK